ncbi:hypothetical protein QDX25_03560 [Auritidibacter ignavus]|uniref:Type ISP restriction-modification enzyme LLaBIII C-terminal specificity domain-containing protein n=1 Tax=Auritidibacter ignavus TaxID=678932 RepID=A0AAJ6APN9_9MICC|nr:type ISP restriction/modification enzyme [Auritidibacter ignavus]WGH82247.1 hypothetical protein QDX25_03560 [Auritidibacter ignavus]WGH93820.1 hypothetical protein QDX21_03205 [Auritidibacter ignavus]
MNQRNDDFHTWPVLGDKKSGSSQFFSSYSLGLATGRDAWVTAESENKLLEQICILIDGYNNAKLAFEAWAEKENIFNSDENTVNDFLLENPQFADKSRFSWNSNLKQTLARSETVAYNSSGPVQSLYRPFTKVWTYFDKKLNARTYRLPSIFPTPAHNNLGFYVVNPGSAKPFSTIATNLIPDLAMWGSNTGQFFPRFTWAPVETDDGLFAEGIAMTQEHEPSEYGEIGELADGYVRVDNITDEIKGIYRDALGADITGDDIFHFVYGKLHDPTYRKTYAADLKKMLPHIETPISREEFDTFATAGRELMQLHVGYEDVEPWPVTITVTGDENDRETWRVTKMAWAKTTDPETGKKVNDVTTLKYNKHITISDIPAEADEYMLGSRSALGWIVDRYQVKKDKASGIINDPNDWADEVGNPRYIAELIQKVTSVAVQTVRVVEGLGSTPTD